MSAAGLEAMLEYREYWTESKRPASKLRSPVYIFMGLCVLVWIAQQIFENSSLRTSLSLYLGLSPEGFWTRLWLWQIFTYGFLHDTGSLWHIGFNLFIIWWVGRELEVLYGAGRLILLMLGSCLLAGLSHITVMYTSSYATPVIGASGIAMGMLVAFTFKYPHRTIRFMFLIRMEMWVACVIIVGLDVIQFLGNEQTVAHLAHLGGAFFGMLFHKYQSTVIDGVQAFQSKLERKELRRQRLEKAELDQRVDEILAKISEVGLDNLPSDDREFLDNASRRYKERQR